MDFYEHNYENVEAYLHHRAPYLMIDRVVSIEADQVVTAKAFTGEEFFVAGHFPGAPILPGAMMQEMATQSAGVLIAARYNPMRDFDTSDPFFNEYALGVLVRINRARYKSFARPGDSLTASVKLSDQLNNIFEFVASISVAGKTIMTNSFQLTNIKSTVLQGA